MEHVSEWEAAGDDDGGGVCSLPLGGRTEAHARAQRARDRPFDVAQGHPECNRGASGETARPTLHADDAPQVQHENDQEEAPSEMPPPRGPPM